MQLLTLTIKQLQLMLRNRVAILVLLAAPVLLAYLFTFSQDSSRPVLYIADQDQSSYSKQLINAIRDHYNVNGISASEREIRNKISAHKIEEGLILQRGFGDSKNLNHTRSHLKLILEKGSASHELEVAVGTELSLLSSGHVDTKLQQNNIEKTNLDNNMKMHTELIQKRLNGFMLMFLWFVAVQGFRTWVDEKENGIQTRLLTTPIQYLKYYLSKVFAAYLLGLLNIGVVLFAGKWILHLNLSQGLMIKLSLWASYDLAITGLILLLVPWVKNHQNFTVCGSLIMVICGIMGGSFFSIENSFPLWFRMISKAIPGTWAAEGLNHAENASYTLQSAVGTISLLCCIGLLGIGGAMFLIRTQIRQHA